MQPQARPINLLKARGGLDGSSRLYISTNRKARISGLLISTSYWFCSKHQSVL